MKEPLTCDCDEYPCSHMEARCVLCLERVVEGTVHNAAKLGEPCRVTNAYKEEAENWKRYAEDLEEKLKPTSAPCNRCGKPVDTHEVFGACN